MSSILSSWATEETKQFKQTTCCFVGHRKLSPKKINRIVKRLNEEVDKLIQQGVIHYFCGGTLGFDHIAASMIITKKQQGANIQLIIENNVNYPRNDIGIARCSLNCTG